MKVKRKAPKRKPTNLGNVLLHVDRDPHHHTHMSLNSPSSAAAAAKRNISETNARMQPRYWVGVVAAAAAAPNHAKRNGLKFSSPPG